MTWAKGLITRLKNGETVSFCPKGNSMTPLIESGQRVTVEPLPPDRVLVQYDVVLCSVGKYDYLHRILSVITAPGKGHRTAQYVIGNNKNRVNGTCGRDTIWGVLQSIG